MYPAKFQEKRFTTPCISFPFGGTSLRHVYKKLLVTSASLLVTSALLLVTRTLLGPFKTALYWKGNKKLLATSASLLVTSALLLVTRSY